MSRSRVLRPTTIIPDELYVSRAADRQLEQIIEDMGRPGYVLVARQMGKTNLLIHMKRRRDAMGDAVIYVDMSERFESARPCFRYIIDLALETHCDTFKNAALQIYRERDQESLQPATEFGRHLRALLKCIPNNKLVVVLDEIDSLVNVNYGDAILSQVRSTYFTRTNYPDFDRLTYVLSGVAEPTDLIRDKNISPFNIGEKIYLEDFSRPEFEEFIAKAKLSLSPEVKESIYGWTSGNPRMTWDVCSSLEDIGDVENGLTPEVVDQVVQTLYLESYDRAPVDHIRVLVAGETQLRNALIALRYGKGEMVEEKTRGRLYLAGITNSPSANPKIKNKIIDMSLSDTWLAQAAPLSLDITTTAAEHFGGKRYRAVIDALRGPRSQGAVFPSWTHIQLGISYYHLDEYEPAILELQESLAGSTGDIRTTALYYLGSSMLLSNRARESVSILDEAAEGSGDFALPAKILLIAALYRAGDKPSQRITLLKNELLSLLNAHPSIEDPRARENVATSLYNLALAASAAGDQSAVMDYLMRAKTLASPDMQPTILVTAAATAEQSSQRRKHAADAAAIVLAEELRFSTNGESTLAFRERTFAALLAVLLGTGQSEIADRLISYGSAIFASGETALEALVRLAASLSEEAPSDVLPLLLRIEGDPRASDLSLPSQLDLLRLLAMHQDSAGDEAATKTYFRFLATIEDVSAVKEADAVFIVATVQRWSSGGRRREALALIEDIYPKISSEFKLYAFILLFYKMLLYQALKDQAAAKAAATELLSISDSVDLAHGEGDQFATFIDGVVKQARSTLAGATSHMPDPFRGIGRNQKVVVTNPDGSNERTMKFKQIEQALRTGRLTLVRTLPR